MSVAGGRHFWMRRGAEEACHCGAERMRMGTRDVFYRIPMPSGGFSAWEPERPDHAAMMCSPQEGARK